MKNQILFMCSVLIAISGFSTTLLLQVQPPVEEVEITVGGVVGFFLPAIIASFIVLLTDASKWWNTGLWSWNVFWDSKIKPLLISIGVAIAIYLLIVFMPFMKPVLAAMANYNLTELTGFTLIGLATALIDNLTKSKPSPEEKQAFVRQHGIPGDDL